MSTQSLEKQVKMLQDRVTKLEAEALKNQARFRVIATRLRQVVQVIDDKRELPTALGALATDLLQSIPEN